MKNLSLILVLTTVFSSSAFAKKFVFDPAHSSIEFSVKHLGIVPVNGSFKKFTGSFEIDEKTGEAKNLIVKIDVDSIYTNEEDRDAHLRTKDFFHVRNDTYDIVEKNRYMVFKASNFSVAGKEIAGKLKILKKTRNVKLKSILKAIKLKDKIVKVGIEASGEVNRKKFGLTWQKSGTGFLAKAAGKFVGDEVKIMVNAVAQPEKK